MNDAEIRVGREMPPRVIEYKCESCGGLRKFGFLKMDGDVAVYACLECGWLLRVHVNHFKMGIIKGVRRGKK